MWFYRVGQSREIGKEHDDDSVEEGFQLARVKFDRDGGGGREILGVGCCSINIWDRSELKLARSRESSPYFENNFPIFLLSGNSIFLKVNDVLHWVHLMFYIE